MKSTFITLLFFSFLSISIAQNPQDIDNPGASLTLGVLQGGGGLIGADLEYLLTEKLGVQVGLGFYSFGAGINYHFKPAIRSSFISFQYRKQGLTENFVQTLLGPSYVFRAKKIFTCQIGLAKTIAKGPLYPKDKPFPPVMLVYSIGIYLPM